MIRDAEDARELSAVPIDESTTIDNILALIEKRARQQHRTLDVSLDRDSYSAEYLELTSLGFQLTILTDRTIRIEW